MFQSQFHTNRPGGPTEIERTSEQRVMAFMERMARTVPHPQYLSMLSLWFTNLQLVNLVRREIDNPDMLDTMRLTVLMIGSELGLQSEHCVTLASLMAEPWPGLFDGIPPCDCKACDQERAVRNQDLN